ncbi:sensor histidine kinase [Kribbella catacumbae]|uniref:sensor histidine kinase n=1 Tax=Kribbella catacumbae TaxID=460086 RepID=UPI00035D28AF|nr:sensor histidine kinase [Kribbella catacumbae]
MSSKWPAGRAGAGATAGVVALLVLTTADLGQHYRLPLGAALALGAARALGLALVWLRPAGALPVSLATSAVTAAVCVPVSPGEPWPWPVTGVFGHSVVLAIVGARGASRRELAGWWLATQLVGVAGMTVAPERGSWPGLLTMAVFSAVAVVVADLLRSRTEARQQLVEQEGISAAERTQRARLQERARIARELHDVVAHHLSVVVVRADSAPHRLTGLPDDAREEFAGIAEDARSSLTEMRRVLRLLREDPGDGPSAQLGPQPALGDLAELVAGTRRAGADVRLDVEPLTGLDPAVELTAYRVVQEAVSNAVRHARGTVVDVQVRRVGGELMVRVVNGSAGEQAATAPGSGHGLVGMRERVGLLDGRFDAGPTADGGYVVEAALPLEGEGMA